MVIEGTFLFEIEGELHQAGPGDVAFVPRKAVHAFKNIGDRAGRLRYIFHRPAQRRTCFGHSTKSNKMVN